MSITIILYHHQQQQQQNHYGVSSPTILIADKVLTHQALFYPYISDTQLQTIALSSNTPVSVPFPNYAQMLR